MRKTSSADRPGLFRISTLSLFPGNPSAIFEGQINLAVAFRAYLLYRVRFFFFIEHSARGGGCHFRNATRKGLAIFLCF